MAKAAPRPNRPSANASGWWRRRRSQLRRQAWLQVLVFFLIWKLVVGGLAYFSSYKLGLGQHDLWATSPAPQLLKHTFKWDSAWYLAIATDGYKFSRAAPAFYPLFPALVRGGHAWLGLNPVTIGFIINSLATYFAFLFLLLIAQYFFRGGERGSGSEADQADVAQAGKLAWRSLLLFAFFPTAFFLEAFYTEALFCALGFGAFYFALRRRWWTANILLAILTALRLPGLIFAGAVFIEYLDSIQFRPKQLDWNVLSFVLAPLGFVAYVVYMAVRYHNALAMFAAYKYGWPYEVLNPNIPGTATHQLRMLLGSLRHRPAGWQVTFFDLFLSAAAWFGALALAVYGLVKKFRLSFVALILAGLVIYSINSNLVSAARYVLPLFPLYLLVVLLLRRRGEQWYSLVLASSAMGLVLLYVLFANGIWVA